MNVGTPFWRRLRPVLAVDAPLAAILALLITSGLVTLYSAAADFPAGSNCSCATWRWPCC
jgi:rod shape determining protein RodA